MAGTTPFTTLRVVRLDRERASLPSYATSGAAGLDLAAALSEPLTLAPGERYAVPTGLAIALPSGTEGQMRPRSGLALKHGITLLNAPGTIDEDYRGEVKAILINLGQAPYTIQPGDRIAQLVVAPVLRVTVQEEATTEAFGKTARGDGGFGSTGFGQQQ